MSFSLLNTNVKYRDVFANFSEKSITMKFLNKHFFKRLQCTCVNVILRYSVGKKSAPKRGRCQNCQIAEAGVQI